MVLFERGGIMNRVSFNEPTVVYRLPQPPAPAMQPGAFVLCPFFPAQQVCDELRQCQMALYRLAFEKAQAAVRPSLLERDLVGVWN
jgi:hypothetical protein